MLVQVRRARIKERKHKAAWHKSAPDFHSVYAVKVDAHHETIVYHLPSAGSDEPGLAIHVALPIYGNALE